MSANGAYRGVAEPHEASLADAVSVSTCPTAHNANLVSWCQPVADIEAWLDGCDADSLWWQQQPCNANALPAMRAAQLLNTIGPEHAADASWCVAPGSGMNTPQLSQQCSPQSGPPTPVLVHSPDSFCPPACGYSPADGHDPTQRSLHQLDSPASRDDADHSCGGSIARTGRACPTALAGASHGQSAWASGCARHEHPLPKWQNKPSSAHAAPVLSETVLSSGSGDEASLDDRQSSGEIAYSSDSDPDPVTADEGMAELSDEPSAAETGTEHDSGSDSQDDDLSDLDMQMGVAFCTNCTARVSSEGFCPYCHWHADQDELLFSASPDPSQPPAPPPAHGGIALAWDDRMQLHCEGQPRPHPERPDRIKAVMARLLSCNITARCRRLPSREATDKEVALCHQPELYSRVEAACVRSELLRKVELDGDLEAAAALRETCVYFKSDTYANPSTALCARLAAGASIDATLAVATGKAAMGAAIVRPPGHHAESSTPMGFCFFNNAALAAQAARNAGAKRVIILDWDVHHGNGSQHMFEDDDSVMYMSVHRFDGGHFYPGTGSVSEVGTGKGEGFTINVPWAMGEMGDADYLAAFNHVFVPIAYEYKPDLIIVSAGYDAAKGDPMGGCCVSSTGFAHMTALLAAVAPLSVILEGGYNLEATASGVEATMRVLLGERPPRLPVTTPPASPIAMMVIQEVIATQSRYWRCLQGLTQRSSFAQCWPFPTDDIQPASPVSPLPATDSAAPISLKEAARAASLASQAPPVTDRDGVAAHCTERPPTFDRGTDAASTAVSAEAVSSPTRGVPHSFSTLLAHKQRHFVRTKLQVGRFEGKRQRRWAITHALQLAPHTHLKRQAAHAQRKQSQHPRSNCTSPISPARAPQSNGHA